MKMQGTGWRILDFLVLGFSHLLVWFLSAFFFFLSIALVLLLTLGPMALVAYAGIEIAKILVRGPA